MSNLFRGIVARGDLAALYICAPASAKQLRGHVRLIQLQTNQLHYGTYN